MNKIIFIITMVMLFIALTGCVRSPTTTYEVMPVLVPESYLISCDPIPPPTQKEYLAMSRDEREIELSRYISTLLSTLNKCGGQLEMIKDWNTFNKCNYFNPLNNGETECHLQNL